MYIPKKMSDIIARTFYDKTIDILGKQVITDSEGGVRSSSLTLIDRFNGNVNFSNCKKIEEDYGLDYQIDVSITTDYSLIKINDIIRYQDINYNVTDVLPSDSHKLIVAKKCR